MRAIHTERVPPVSSIYARCASTPTTGDTADTRVDREAESKWWSGVVRVSNPPRNCWHRHDTGDTAVGVAA